jgi:3-phenylpropionate/trans-cinnamate dioxygenase ferredoxin reductase subunit
MAHYRYLIIGGGMTGEAAIRGIRELDSNGSIGLIGMEQDPPYKRPPLSKALWKGKPLESIWRKTEGSGAELHLGCKAVILSPEKKEVRDAEGVTHTYDKLLVATGGTPRTLPFGGEDIIYFRTLKDYQRLRYLSEQSELIGVIGGGFIGSEIAAALTMNGIKTVMVVPEEGIAAHMVPRDLSLFLSDYYRKKGVELIAGERLGRVEKKGDRLAMMTKSGRSIPVDGIVAGVGIQPNVELALKAGLKTGNGIIVDEQLRAGHPDVFAAGDVAEFHNPALGKRIRVEHEDNADTMGRQAGRNMAGAEEPYTHLPYFYSDLFELGYEAVGELNSRLQTFSDWIERHHKGVVYYLEGSRVRGVLLWNVWDQVDAARKLIAEPGPFRPEDLKGRLPA